MKIRSGFVTNSSSSSFILHLEKISKKDRKTILKMIKSPLDYKQEYIDWHNKYFPRYHKENPNGIEMSLIVEKNGQRTVEHNPEYDKLPDVLFDYANVCDMNDASEWDIRRIDKNTYDFRVFMDNFDYIDYLQFAFEKTLGKHYNECEPNELQELGFERERNEFVNEFISDLSDVADDLIRKTNRFKHRKLKIKYEYLTKSGRMVIKSH